jgi:hypothetical protein
MALLGYRYLRLQFGVSGIWIRVLEMTRLAQTASLHIQHCPFQAIPFSNHTAIPYAVVSTNPVPLTKSFVLNLNELIQGLSGIPVLVLCLSSNTHIQFNHLFFHIGSRY